MFEIAGGILLAFFVLWAIFRVEDSPTTDESYTIVAKKRHPRYSMTISAPRIVVFAIFVVILIILVKLL